jgi:hypothetical protein
LADFDKEIFDLAEQVLGQRHLRSDPRPAEPNAEPQAPEVTVEADRTDMPEGKVTKTAAELAQMIEADLAKRPQCPKYGFKVTVYGSTLWRAMLTITPAAGPVFNPQEWRDLTEELAERLRKRYELEWRQGGGRSVKFRSYSKLSFICRSERALSLA